MNRDISIIVAGGSGSRMGASQPKQFLALGGEAVLLRTLRRFACALPGTRLIVALPQPWFPLWHDLCVAASDVPRHEVVAGGATRFDSVKCALAAIGDCAAGDVVGVHDGVRPLVSADLIRRVYATARRLGSAVPAVAVTDSVRQLTSDGSSRQLLRDGLRAVQTPQAFRLDALLAAYDTAYDPLFTDDASVAEHAGMAIHLVDGETTNIKLTRPQDFVLAEYLLNTQP